MTQPERVYSVLLVSAAESFNTAIGELLTTSVFSPVNTVSAVSAAKRAFAERAYDIVIVNSPLPDDPGIRFALDAGAGTPILALFGATRTMGINAHGISGSDPGAVPGGSTRSPSLGEHGAETGSTNV